jgi:hypothetical protein
MNAVVNAPACGSLLNERRTMNGLCFARRDERAPVLPEPVCALPFSLSAGGGRAQSLTGELILP